MIADTGEESASYTEGNQQKFPEICTLIGTELCLSVDRIHDLHLVTKIHDPGKTEIPVEILSKARKLTTMEYSIINEHPTITFNILKDISFPRPISQIILQHHERIDVSGYPLGVEGDAMKLESRYL